MTNAIVDISMSASSYTVPYSHELTNVETILVIAFFAALTTIVALSIVWTCFNRIVYRVVFGVMYVVGHVAAWILSGFVVSVLLYYIKPIP